MVSLENEYFTWKQALKNAQEKLAKMESLDVEKMTQEQLEARERVIKGAKEEIKECEEMLEEIKEELVEFINNGGEVSEKTKEAINYFEPIRVDFKIVSNRNDEVYIEGYVNINDAEAEDVDWYYYDAQGMATSQMFVEHNGVDGFKGATDKQKWEVEQFRGDYGEDAFWIDEVILQSDEDENKTHVRENLTLIINEGATFEVEICKYEPLDFYTNYSNAFEIGRQYFMTFKPKYNGESVVDLIKEYLEYGILEHPYTYDMITANTPKYNESPADFNKDSIAMEVPKICFKWEDDYEEDTVDDILSEFKDALESAYRKALIREVGVAGIASSMYEEKLKKENSMEVFNESGIQDFGNAWEDTFEEEDLWILYNLKSEDVEKSVKDEWIEEEDYYEGYE